MSDNRDEDVTQSKVSAMNDSLCSKQPIPPKPKSESPQQSGLPLQFDDPPDGIQIHSTSRIDPNEVDQHLATTKWDFGQANNRAYNRACGYCAKYVGRMLKAHYDQNHKGMQPKYLEYMNEEPKDPYV